MRSEGATSLVALVNKKVLLDYLKIKKNPFGSDCSLSQRQVLLSLQTSVCKSLMSTFVGSFFLKNPSLSIVTFHLVKNKQDSITNIDLNKLWFRRLWLSATSTRLHCDVYLIMAINFSEGICFSICNKVCSQC